MLLRCERASLRLRQPLDVLRSALLSADEKDALRRTLYSRSSVQEFTSLDENVAAGLTLLEEVALARHPLEPGRALVLGCGPGRESFVLARRGFQVTGLDREPGMLERVRQRAAELGLAVDLVRGEAQDFRVPGPPFDLVVVFSGLYNMVMPRSRRVGMLRCAWQHLRPGGRLYRSRALLHFATWMGGAGLLAILAGWFTTEIGRQPWLVQGLMRTAEGVSAHSTGQVGLTLALFVVVYFVVFGAGTVYALRLIRRGPRLHEGETPVLGGPGRPHQAMRPLSAADADPDASPPPAGAACSSSCTDALNALSDTAPKTRA